VSLSDRSVLFAPAHYVTGRDVGGSELQWAFDIVSQGARRFGTVDAVLCDLRNGSFPANVRVHEVDKGRDANYYLPRESALFVARYTRAALRVCRRAAPSLLHHVFPWGARTFNPLILWRGTPFGMPASTRVVIGPLQEPIFGHATVEEEGYRFRADAQARHDASARALRDASARPGLQFGPLEPPLRALCRATLRKADAIIALTNGARDYVRALGVETPIHVVPAGARVDAYPAREPSANGAPLRVICLSYLIARKRIELTVQAIARVRARGKDVTLTIAGDGPERARLETLIGELRLDGAVRMTGYVDHDQTPALLANADLFVTMSDIETLPAAVIEAMAAGLPVISTRTEGAVELVEDGVTGSLVPFDDAQALAQQIERFADDAPMRTACGLAARRRAQQDLSWDAIGTRYAEIYESVLG